MNYDAYGNPLPQYEQNVTMTNPGPTGPITQNAWSQEFATPETAQRLAAQTGGQAVARTPSVGSFSTGTQQMLNYGGSDINAGLAANNAAQYGSAPGSYGSYLNARDAATSQGKPAPSNPWDNPNVDTNLMQTYQGNADRLQRGQLMSELGVAQPGSPNYQAQVAMGLNPQNYYGHISPQQGYRQSQIFNNTMLPQYQAQDRYDVANTTHTMGKPLQATTTPGYQNPQQPSAPPTTGTSGGGGAPGTSTQANSMAGAQAAVGPTNGYTGTIGNQTFENGALQQGGSGHQGSGHQGYGQMNRQSGGGSGYGNYGQQNYGQYRSQQGGYGYGQQPQSRSWDQGMGSTAASPGWGASNGYSGQYGQRSNQMGNSGRSPYGGWAQPQRMGYGNYGQQQNPSQQPIQRRTPEGPGNSTSSF